MPSYDDQILMQNKFMDAALGQRGDKYRYGAHAGADDADPKEFDSSELVEWAAHRAGIQDMPDGAWEQYRYLLGDTDGDGIPDSEVAVPDEPDERGEFVPDRATTVPGSRPPTHVPDDDPVVPAAPGQGSGSSSQVIQHDLPGSEEPEAVASYGGDPLSDDLAYHPADDGAAGPAEPAAIPAAAPEPDAVTGADPAAPPEPDAVSGADRAAEQRQASFADADGDGLSDQFERRLGTNVNDEDTDGDRYPDGMEVRWSTNPRVPSASDYDDYRVPNENESAAEWEASEGLEPNADSDGDGVADWIERDGLDKVPNLQPDHITSNKSPIDQFVDSALAQRGKPYRFGAEVDPASSEGGEAFDSAELVEWAAKQAGVRDMPDGTWNQYQWLDGQDATTSVQDALKVKGALVFGFSSNPVEGIPDRRYVAISVGNGRDVIEVSERTGEVRVVPAAGGNYEYGAKIPALHAPDDDLDGDGVSDQDELSRGDVSRSIVHDPDGIEIEDDEPGEGSGAGSGSGTTDPAATDLATSIAPATPARTADPASSNGSIKPTGTGDPASPAAPAGPVDAAGTPDPTAPVDSLSPVSPIAPAGTPGATAPTLPVTPVTPAALAAATLVDPVNPIDAVAQDTGTDPTEPTDPTAPTDPGTGGTDPLGTGRYEDDPLATPGDSSTNPTVDDPYDSTYDDTGAAGPYDPETGDDDGWGSPRAGGDQGDPYGEGTGDAGSYGPAAGDAYGDSSYVDSSYDDGGAGESYGDATYSDASTYE